MENVWTPRGQGDQGEASAISWLLSKGACVFVPAGHTPADYDLLTDFDGRVLKVQVKTSTSWIDGRFHVSVATRGGNQSWTGLVKKFDPLKCDYLFAHVGDGRRWFIPSHVLDGTTKILLGGPKYSEYEIDPGRLLESRSGTTEYTR